MPYALCLSSAALSCITNNMHDVSHCELLEENQGRKRSDLFYSLLPFSNTLMKCGSSYISYFKDVNALARIVTQLLQSNSVFASNVYVIGEGEFSHKKKRDLADLRKLILGLSSSNKLISTLM